MKRLFVVCIALFFMAGTLVAKTEVQLGISWNSQHLYKSIYFQQKGFGVNTFFVSISSGILNVKPYQMFSSYYHETGLSAALTLNLKSDISISVWANPLIFRNLKQSPDYKAACLAGVETRHDKADVGIGIVYVYLHDEKNCNGFFYYANIHRQLFQFIDVLAEAGYHDNFAGISGFAGSIQVSKAIVISKSYELRPFYQWYFGQKSVNEHKSAHVVGITGSLNL